MPSARRATTSFEPVSKITNLGEQEPVITLRIAEQVRAYPLRVLTWHEIANDTLAGVPVAVTYCPLCNAALVFDRRLDGAPDRRPGHPAIDPVP